MRFLKRLVPVLVVLSVPAVLFAAEKAAEAACSCCCPLCCGM
jgi:hypothetical protein